MDLGRLVSFIRKRETSVEDVRRYVTRLRSIAVDGVATVGHAELSDRDRVLLSIAERAGAVELEPGGADGLMVTLTGKGSARLAQGAIAAAKDRAWDAYHSIARFSADGQRCRRRQILDHFGDHEPGAPTGRCCDVCDPDGELLDAVRAAPVRMRRRSGGRAGRGAAAAAVSEPVDERAFEALRAWRQDRAEGKPAFIVASDAVLRALLGRRPRTIPELLQIKGIGPAFCNKHGESALAALAALD
jgi:superfamily II DNA helicase RecQ